MLNIFDSYERVARIYPALIISFPVIVTCYAVSILFDSSVTIKISINSPIVIATLILLSNIVRHYGKEIEKKIWDSWEGAPSTRFLRKGDNHFAEGTKKKIYQKIAKDTGIDLLKENTDEKISQAFAVIRNKLREVKDRGLWVKFNQEYGFLRNIIGSRMVWVTFSFVLSSICLIVYVKMNQNSDLILICGVINFISGVMAIICGWCIFPKLIKGIAERYAEDAIASYLNLRKE